MDTSHTHSLVSVPTTSPELTSGASSRYRSYLFFCFWCNYIPWYQVNRPFECLRLTPPFECRYNLQHAKRTTYNVVLWCYGIALDDVYHRKACNYRGTGIHRDDGIYLWYRTRFMRFWGGFVVVFGVVSPCLTHTPAQCRGY